MTPDDLTRIRILRLERKLARTRHKRNAAYKQLATYRLYLGDCEWTLKQIENRSTWQLADFRRRIEVRLFWLQVFIGFVVGFLVSWLFQLRSFWP